MNRSYLPRTPRSPAIAPRSPRLSSRAWNTTALPPRTLKLISKLIGLLDRALDHIESLPRRVVASRTFLAACSNTRGLLEHSHGIRDASSSSNQGHALRDPFVISGTNIPRVADFNQGRVTPPRSRILIGSSIADIEHSFVGPHRSKHSSSRLNQKATRPATSTKATLPFPDA